MNFVALRMLVGDRAKYLGIIVGLTFASLLITQQLSIFTGLMSRTFGAISSAPSLRRNSLSPVSRMNLSAQGSSAAVGDAG